MPTGSSCRNSTRKNPSGKFEITRTRIAENGINAGELLVFSFEGELVYFAHSASGRRTNDDEATEERCPYYFCVDIETIAPMSGKLVDLQKELAAANLHHGQLLSSGWPIVSEAEGRREKLVELLGKFQANTEEESFLEGERRAAKSIARNANLRIAAKRRWGLKCYCCGFDFEDFYGAVAHGCAIVHHLETFEGADGAARSSTVDDVRVVCANCHYVIHKVTPALAVDELRDCLAVGWTRWSDQGVSRK